MKNYLKGKWCVLAEGSSVKEALKMSRILAFISRVVQRFHDGSRGVRVVVYGERLLIRYSKTEKTPSKSSVNEKE